MTPGAAYDHNPYSTRHVIGTVRALMRTDGLDVSLTAIARGCGTSRNFLYANWRSVRALHLLALKAELVGAFDTAGRTRPRDGTAAGIAEHLAQVVRTVRRHPTTAAVARSSPTAFARAHTATDGPLVRTATELVGDLLHPLAPLGGIWSDPALTSLAWKILWIARPAALCPEAVGDRDREDTLDRAFTELLRDLLAPWATPR
ncbi:hypothetical protein SUDANB58_01981 [Streptomyces sp. enrichment culture]|uniref:hypothetical protein n=1 Tax=Streptomyces sp. enrichment culture TaxID=1795815 RepID=UPI003F54BB59